MKRLLWHKLQFSKSISQSQCKLLCIKLIHVHIRSLSKYNGFFFLSNINRCLIMDILNQGCYQTNNYPMRNSFRKNSNLYSNFTILLKYQVKLFRDGIRKHLLLQLSMRVSGNCFVLSNKDFSRFLRNIWTKIWFHRENFGWKLLRLFQISTAMKHRPTHNELNEWIRLCLVNQSFETSSNARISNGLFQILHILLTSVYAICGVNIRLPRSFYVWLMISSEIV